jgi:biopolymer transport protein ExbB
MVEFFGHIIFIFGKGGLVMYPLLICSVMVVAIAIERYRYFRHAQTNIDKLLSDIAPKLQNGDWDGAVTLCKADSGIGAAMLAKGLSVTSKDRLEQEQMLESVATLAVAKLRYRLNYLDTIVTLAPLLGLLGTVTGMIQAFSVLTIRTGQPLAITGGVGEALVATAAGLCVAIMALIAHSYFSHRLDILITDMEQVSNYVLAVSSHRGSR